jgi:hypothetical protein
LIIAEGDHSTFFDQGQSDQRSITTLKIQNYEKGDLEIDSADIGFDTDCTGNHARSDELYVAQNRATYERDRALDVRALSLLVL